MARAKKIEPEAEEQEVAEAEPKIAEASEVFAGGAVEQIDVIQVDVKEPVKEPTSRYWMGAIDGAPRHIFYAAAQDFPQWTENVDHNNDLNVTNRTRVRGTENDLTPTRVEVIKMSIAKKVVRTFRGADGKITGGQVLNTDTAHYVRDERDEPAAKYVYMVRLSDRMPHNYRSMTPPTMARPVGR